MSIVIRWESGDEDKYDTLEEAADAIEAGLVQTSASPRRVTVEGVEYVAVLKVTLIPDQDAAYQHLRDTTLTGD